MTYAVFDASFVAKANGDLRGLKEGNLLARRINAIRSVTEKKVVLRFNGKLLKEYEPLIKECRNDVIEEFISWLDKEETVYLPSSTLRRHEKKKANDCRWPTHDQHVLAAAIGAEEVTIHVTENALGACRVEIKRVFGYSINHVA